MAAILFIVFLGLLVLGVPVAFSICSAAAVTIATGLGTKNLLMVIQRMFESCNSFNCSSCW